MAQSRFKAEFTCDNAAFTETRESMGPEIARILREIASEVESLGPDSPYTINDVNGNTVGKVSFFPPDDWEDLDD